MSSVSKSSQSAADDPATPKRHTAGLFDVRNIVGALLGIYGIVLTVMGLVNFTSDDKAKADDVNLNLWTGIGLIVVAGVMIAWCALRPIVVDEEQLERDKAVQEELATPPVAPPQDEVADR